MLRYKIKSFAVVLCAVLIIGAATTGYAQGNNDQLNALRQAAQAGDIQAAISLGDTYHNGWGVEKNEEEAVKWYCTALGCEGIAGAGAPDQEGGNDGAVAVSLSVASAESSIGQAYATGHGIPQDDKKAITWYLRAARHGNAAALNSLGNAYSSGQLGVKQDKAAAAVWYQKAANLGNADAEYSLGEAYHNGDGVAKDDGQATAWYQKAAEQGNAQASGRLAEIEATPQGFFHMKNSPGAGEMLIFVISAIGLVFFATEMRKKGTERYELKFFLCPQFGLLIFGALFFYITNMLTGTCAPNGQDVLMCDGGGNDAAKWICLLTFAIALTMNINKSNASFGVIYTIAQLVTAYTFFPAFIMEIFKKTSKR